MSAIEMQPVVVCKICGHRVDEGQPVHICPECRSVYHQPCWEHLGGCAVYGCVHMVAVKKADDEAVTIWGVSEKVCPACAEKIPAAALQCPLCKTKFDEIRPMAREELLRQPDDPGLRSYRRKAGWLLLFSMIGFTSPLALLAGGLWYWRKKDEIERVGTAVKGLVLLALLIAIAYVALVGFGLLVFWLKGAQG